MNVPTIEQLATLSVKGLQCAAELLNGKTVRRSETKVNAAQRVVGLLKVDTDASTSLSNLPDLLKSRAFMDDAIVLRHLLEDASGPEVEAEEVIDEPAEEVEATESTETQDEETDMAKKAAERVRGKIASVKGTARTVADKAKLKAAETKAAKQMKTAAEARAKVEAEELAQNRIEVAARVAAMEADSAKAELDQAILEHRQAMEAVKAAQAAAKVTKARFLAAKKLGRQRGVVAPGSNGKGRSRTNGQLTPGTNDHNLFLMLTRPEGVTQAQAVAQYHHYTSTAWHTNRLAKRVGMNVVIEGTGRDRVFRLAPLAE